MAPSTISLNPACSKYSSAACSEAEDAPKADDDPIVLLKCLEMIFRLMQDPQIKTLNPVLLTLMEEGDELVSL